MEIKITVIVAKAIHREKEVWLLKFADDRKLLNRIRQIGHLRWSQTIRCWYGPGTDKFMDELRALEGVQIQVRKYTPSLESVPSTLKSSPQKNEQKSRTEPKNQDYRQRKSSRIPLKENSTPPISLGAQKDLESWKTYLQSRQYAQQTIQVYSFALRVFLSWLGEIHHKEVRTEHVNNYMKHLVNERGVSRSYQNQHVNAIKSFYKFTISIHLSSDMIIRPRREYKLPHYLTREEVSKLFSSLGNLKHRAMVSLVYACGLRLGETIRLRLTDIDVSQRLLVVRQSKGNKDRVVPVPESILQMLNEYAMAYKPQIFLFEGQFDGEAYSERSLQQVFKGAVRKSGIRQTEASLHWLRHSYATHLLEMGTNLRDLQTLLGHKNLKTTEGYTHISSTKFTHIVSPFDVLPDNKKAQSLPSPQKKLYF